MKSKFNIEDFITFKDVSIDEILKDAPKRSFNKRIIKALENKGFSNIYLSKKFTWYIESESIDRKIAGDYFGSTVKEVLRNIEKL